MATDVAALVQQAVAAIKAGNKAQAKDLLTKAVELDDQNEQGWLWLSACVDTVEEQQICLENVLALNPNNEKARKGLAAIAKQTGQQPAVSAPAAPKSNTPLPSTDPFAGSPFDSGPEDAKADNPLGSGWDQFDTSSVDDSFLSNAPQNAPAPATSVDWSSGGSAHGSGKNVDLPSPDEYDNWVTGLSLGGASATPPKSAKQPAPSPAPDPFGTSSMDSTFDSQADPFGGPAPAQASSSDDPFSDFNFDKVDSASGSAGTGPFGGANDPFDSGPFSATSPSAPSTAKGNRTPGSDQFSSGPFGVSDPFSAPSSPGADPFADNDFGDANQGAGSAISDDIFSGVPNTPKRADTPKGGKAKPVTSSLSRGGVSPSDPFGGGSQSDPFGTASPAFPEMEEEAAPPRRSAPSSGSFAFIDPSARPADAAYFEVIPPEIQADGSAGPQADKRLLATVGILVVLNILSLAFLLVNLTQH
ncbi:MAG TPA: hypothetical protein VKQ72_14545 [Aggregatilineales bacterium]|nr:hypothetical protein [Aggregatilineales bacterium]